MPEYKLFYFDTSGLGETIRFILSYGGQQFEDVRYTLDEWLAAKPSTPYGLVPVLEIDGKRYHQSLAINRYLAKQFKLAGSDDLENLEIDAIVYTINDFRTLFTQYFWDTNPEEKAKKREILISEKMPFYLGKFTNHLEENGGYFCNGKVTWADLLFTSLQDYQNTLIGFDGLKDYPVLKAHTAKILAIPSIKALIDKRPNTCVIRELMKTM